MSLLAKKSKQNLTIFTTLAKPVPRPIMRQVNQETLILFDMSRFEPWIKCVIPHCNDKDPIKETPIPIYTNKQGAKMLFSP